MSNITRSHALKGEWTPNPDREMLLFALCLGAIARGRTILEEACETPPSREFAHWLNQNNIPCSFAEQTWTIEGAGLGGSFSPVQTLPSNHLAQFLALCMLSRDLETLFDFGADAEPGDLGKVLGAHFQGSWKEGRWSFREPSLQWKLSPTGAVESFARMRLLLQALMHERTLVLEERVTVRDQLSGLLGYFAAPITVELSGVEEMDELSRRMARLQGQKLERKTVTRLSPCKAISGKDLFIPGDPTEAAAMALLASVIPDSEIVIRNVCLNPSRSGVFNALKRMGANFDVAQKKERYGDQFGSLRVQSCKRMVGRKLAGEVLITCIEEVPLLAVAASMAEGETILRLPDPFAEQLRPLLDALALNIRLAGVEVGVYEEGLVVRGREEIDANQFDAGEYAILGLALAVLAKSAHGQSDIMGLAQVESEFPGLLQKWGVTL